MTFVIDRCFDIAAPAEVVWEVISDLPRYREWNPFCVDARSTLTPGEPIDMWVKLGAKPQHQREFIVEFAAGRGFAYAMKPIPGGALRSRREHAIEALDAGHSRYHSRFRLQGWLLPLVRGLLGRRLDAGFAAMNEAVVRRAEQLWAQRRPAG